MVRTWRRSTRSPNGQNCVELSRDAVRDSKNPGPTLTADVAALIAAAKRFG